MELNHVFGLRGDLRGNVFYVDETNVLYPCGHVVVVYNVETKTQRFIPGSERSGGITALAVSHNKKLVAVAERGEKPFVSIYDIASLKKRKTLTCSEFHSNEIITLSFSGDHKQLITQGGAPDWTMVCWAWEKSKVIVTNKTSNIQGSPVTCTDFCPWDNTTFCVIGDGLLRFLRIQDGITKSLPFSFKREVQQYVCHAWLPEERLVVATNAGDLLLFENFEFRGTLSILSQDGEEEQQEGDSEEAGIASLAPYNKGFICGGGDNTLRVFEQSEDPHEYYRHTKTFTIDGMSSQVTNLALSPSEDNLACSLANNQMYVLGLSNTDILKVEEMSFELLTTSVHGPLVPDSKSMQSQALGGGAQGQGGEGARSVDASSRPTAQITGLDVCMRKPYVATCGVDRTVRIWNYLDKVVVLSRVFSEMPLSLSFHPSGLHVLVGFADKLRMMNLLMDDIRPFKELPIKSCRECRFSNGGQYFAAANGNVIQVFQTYTFECLMTLRGHAGRVHSLAWTQDDRILLSAAADGVLYRWCVKDARKDGEFVHKGTSLACAVPADADGTVALCTGKPDIKLKEVQMGTGSNSGSAKFEAAGPLGMGIDQLAITRSGRSIFAALYDQGGLDRVGQATPAGASGSGSGKRSTSGSDKVVGATIMLTLPLASNQAKDAKGSGEAGDEEASGGGNKDSGYGTEQQFHPLMSAEKAAPDAVELQMDKVRRASVHAGAITRMVTSHDDQFLFTAGEDGTLAIYNITEEPEAGNARKSREKEAPIQFAEEILVTKSDMEEKTALMHELKNKVDELTLHNEYQLRLKDMNYTERIKEVTAKFTDELEQDRKKYDKLRKEKLAMENMFKDRLGRLDVQHNEQLEGIEKSYKDKIDAEVNRYEALVKEREQLALEWDERNQVLVESHEKYVNEVTQDFESKLTEELKQREEIEKQKQELVKHFEDNKQEVEEDADLEIEELKEKYVAKLTVEREAKLRLKGENGIMKKKFSALQDDIEEQKEKIKQLTEREMDLYERIKGLEKDIHGHKKEIKEREETIQDKEKRIYDLKKKNQELEKFKFVLDYKIKELKRQIEPRENEIADMRQQIKEMDLELEQYQKSNAALDLMIGELRLKIEGMQKEIDEQNHVLREGKAKADDCRIELDAAVKSLADHSALKAKVVAMYKTYVQAAEANQAAPTSPTKKEAGRRKAGGAKKKGRGSAADRAEGGTGPNVQWEYNRQREYLEKSVESLKRKLNKDMRMHQADKMRLLRESVDLTNEINVLRRELHSHARKLHKRDSPDALRDAALAAEAEAQDSFQTGEVSREIELQRQQIQSLVQQINRLEHALGIK